MICEDNPIKKSRGWLKTLLKFFIVNPRPKESIIKAIAKGKKISEIIPINILLLYYKFLS